MLEGGERHGDGVPEELLGQADVLIREHRNRILEAGDAKVFAEIYGPPPRLLVYGAVDTAEAMCAAVKLIGWRAIVADARAKFATAERIPSADEIVVAWPEEAIDQVAPDHATAVVVLTHDDKFDVPALKAALATEAFYVGALGSRRNQERRRERLLEVGVPEDDIERIHGPCGPRHRRRVAARDGALDPGRDRGCAHEPRRRPAQGLQAAHPRRSRRLTLSTFTPRPRALSVRFAAVSPTRRKERESMAVTANSDELYELVDEGAHVEQLATGFTFTEGPIWHPTQHHLLFSDMPGDVRRRWSEADGVERGHAPERQVQRHDLRRRPATCSSAST